MKKILLTALVLTSSKSLWSQVGVGTTSPQTLLDLRAKNHLGALSSTDGLLVPRVNALGVNGTQNGQLLWLTTPTCTNSSGFNYWNTATNTWKSLFDNTGQTWELNGNSNTVDDASFTLGSNLAVPCAPSFLGTTNAENLVFVANGRPVALLNTDGSFYGGGEYGSRFVWGKNVLRSSVWSNHVFLGDGNSNIGPAQDCDFMIGNNNSHDQFVFVPALLGNDNQYTNNSTYYYLLGNHNRGSNTGQNQARLIGSYNNTTSHGRNETIVLGRYNSVSGTGTPSYRSRVIGKNIAIINGAENYSIGQNSTLRTLSGSGTNLIGDYIRFTAAGPAGTQPQYIALTEGSNSPTANTLNIRGAIKIADSPKATGTSTCSTDKAGVIKYVTTASVGHAYVCDGSNWKQLD